MRRCRIIGVSALLIAVVIAAGGAGVSSGAVPGVNGRIAFDTQNGAFTYSMNADGSDIKSLAEGGEPSWSPDGTKIALYDRNGLAVMNADGSGKTSLGVDGQDPAWSPDGSKIAFDAGNNGGQIYIVDADGSHLTQLTHNVDPLCGGVSQFPAWSPDGTKIAFQWFRGTFGCAVSSNQIYVINADGSGETQLTSNAGHNWWNAFPSWSPDGSRIVFASSRDDNGTNWELYVMNADGTGQTNLTHSAAAEYYPAWSPDGTKIAYSRQTDQANGDIEMFVMNADGSTQTQITHLGALLQAFHPDWQRLVPASGDRTPPKVTITRPADGAVYPLGKAVTAAYKCADNGSGVATCTGTVANGAPIDTSTIGTHTFAVTGTDRAGNRLTVSHHYAVVYTWNGFFRPISNSETSELNLVHAGDLVKIGFGLNGDRGPGVISSVSSTQVSCPAWTPHSVPAAGAGATAGLSYGAASGHYTYGWATQAAWAGTCRRFSLQLNDGTAAHTAVFMFFS